MLVALFCFTYLFVLQSFPSGAMGDCIDIKTRRDWGALRPFAITLQDLPISTVIIAHTAGNTCSTFNSCVKQVQNIQDFHMESRKYDDIGYNFLIGNDGNVYEGRGWDHVGAHSKGHNQGTVCIAFMGTYTTTLPSEEALAAAQHLLACAEHEGNLHKQYKLFAHRQVIPTESPGRMLYSEIQHWPHWTRS